MAKSKKPKPPKALGVGCAILFAIPFASVGLFMGYEVIRALAEHQAMQRWVETPAVITRADLQVHHDEGATYKAIAEYQYEFGGQLRQGSRVGLSTGSDNIGNFQQRVHAELQAHLSNGQPFRCFVNPAQPDQSILYRDLRWEMIAFYDIFVLMFGGFGLGALLGCIMVWRTERRRAALAVEYPDQPWFWRDDWAANEIEITSKHWFFATATCALFWKPDHRSALVAASPADRARKLRGLLGDATPRDWPDLDRRLDPHVAAWSKIRPLHLPHDDSPSRHR